MSSPQHHLQRWRNPSHLRRLEASLSAVAVHALLPRESTRTAPATTKSEASAPPAARDPNHVAKIRSAVEAAGAQLLHDATPIMDHHDNAGQMTMQKRTSIQANCTICTHHQDGARDLHAVRNSPGPGLKAGIQKKKNRSTLQTTTTAHLMKTTLR